MFEAYSHSNHEGLIAASCIEEVRFGIKTGSQPSSIRSLLFPQQRTSQILRATALCGGHSHELRF
jgi:hypothetical protein